MIASETIKPILQNREFPDPAIAADLEAPVEKKRVDAYSFEELVARSHELWKLIIDKQIEGNSPEWKLIVEKKGGVEAAKEFLYAQWERVIVCVDGNFDTYLNKIGVTDPSERKAIQSRMNRQAFPQAGGSDIYNDVFVWIPTKLSQHPRLMHLFIHEMTHASDYIIQKEAYGVITLDKKAQKYIRRIFAGGTLTFFFLCSSSAISVVGLLTPSKIIEHYFAAALSTLGLSAASYINVLYSVLKHGKTPPEIRANTYAKDILNHEI